MTAFLHALSPTGRLIPLICDEDGRLYIEGSISLDASDINIGNVDVASSALPTGAATSAKQDSLIALLPAAFTSGGGVKAGLVDALPAGTNSIGAVFSNSVVSSATITRPADTTAYAAKDVVSTLAGSVIEFTGMARANGGTGTIVRARLMTSQKTNVALYRLHLFHTAPTATADNSPYTLLYANAANRIGAIDFPALSTEDSTNSTAAAGMRPSYDGSYNAPNLWYKCKSDGTSLYGILETLSAFPPDSAQIYFIELGADGLS